MRKSRLFVVCALIVLSFSLGVFADEVAEVFFNVAKVQVNGKMTDAQTILYQGTTFVPVRFVSTELGADVQWDAASKTVVINNKQGQATQAPPQQPAQPEKPKPISKVSFSSLEDFETYLDKNFGKISTPIGELTVVFDVEDHRNDNFLSYDLSIVGRFSEASWSKVRKGLGQAGAKAVKEHMKKVSDVAMESFPDKKMEGYYYTSWYEYPSVQVGYKSTRFYEWRNYKLDYDKPGKAAGRVSSFQWKDDSEMTEKIWFKY